MPMCYNNSTMPTLSDPQKEALRKERLLAVVKSPEYRAKMSARLKGRVITWGDKISAASTGKKIAPETVAKRRATMAAKGGYHPTPETRAKLSAVNKGKKQPVEAVIKTVAANRGRKNSAEVRARMSAARKGKGVGRVIDAATVEKIAAANRGKKRSLEHRRKLSAIHMARFATVPHNGKRPTRALNQCGYDIWREAVFARDNKTCTDCKEPGLKVMVHHIKPWRSHPELRYDVSNGVTLCAKCHAKVDPHYARFNPKLKGVNA